MEQNQHRMHTINFCISRHAARSSDPKALLRLLLLRVLGCSTHGRLSKQSIYIYIHTHSCLERYLTTQIKPRGPSGHPLRYPSLGYPLYPRPYTLNPTILNPKPQKPKPQDPKPLNPQPLKRLHVMQRQVPRAASTAASGSIERKPA